MSNETIYAKMAIDGWQGQVKFFNSALEKLSDDQLMQEISPGRNRGVYLLGHLTAVHDLMMPLLFFGPSLYPELKPIFIDAADKTVADIPSIKQIKEKWNDLNEKLLNHFKDLSPDEWFTRHSSVSEEDFAKEPHRNRLNVLLGRTNHLSYHRGQFALLVKKG